ncbi:MAG TPA: GAF domain-containing protein [Gammaproteobacteria bacterium]|nr:GAF domain-containing protein [Gammaproteobacteria bacterium]
MNSRFWLTFVLSAALIACSLALPFFPISAIPFGINLHHDQFEIIPSPQGIPMPTALRNGDLLRFDQMTPRERLPYMNGPGNPPPGSPLSLAVERDGTILHVSVPVAELPRTFANRMTVLIPDALIWLQTILGLLLLWRGRHKAAAGVAVWCLSGTIDGIAGLLPVPMPMSCFLNAAGNILDNAGTLVGLLLVAEGLARSDATSRWWRWHRPAFGALLSVYLTMVLSMDVFIALTGAIAVPIRFQPMIIVVHLAAFALPILMMLFSYPRVAEANRARIRWFLASMLGIVVAYVMSILPQLVQHSPLTFAFLQMLFSALALSGFSYAVLRHQLVSLRLVVNRALAYGVVTSLVVGVFTVLTALVERNALSEGTNRLLELLVPLLLGVTLHSVKKYVDEWINKWFFRRRYRADAALNHFARTCAYIDKPENLLKLTADELYRHSGAESVAIYLINPASSAAQSIESRGVPLSAIIETDDLALVRLRAGDTDVNLHQLVTAFGGDGFAFPMMMRNRLIGVIVCGPRPAEQYTGDERGLFAHVAHEVGVALHTLELQEQQRLLHELATGSSSSLQDVRARAQALLGAQLPV